MYGLPMQVAHGLISDHRKRDGCSRVFGLAVNGMRSGHHEYPRAGAYRSKRLREPKLSSALPNPGTEPFVMIEIVVHSWR